MPSFLTEYNFGVRLEGVRETRYRGEQFRSGPGTFLAYAPGVALAAKPVSEGSWRYLDMTLPSALLGALLETNPAKLEACSLTGVKAEPDRRLFTLFVESHACFSRSASQLEQETRLLAWLVPLFRTKDGVCTSRGREHRAVNLIQAYPHENLAKNVSLTELSGLVSLNKQYLLRVFKKQVSLTPYQYQLGLRLAEAKNLLWCGLLRRGSPLRSGFTTRVP